MTLLYNGVQYDVELEGDEIEAINIPEGEDAERIVQVLNNSNTFVETYWTHKAILVFLDECIKRKTLIRDPNIHSQKLFMSIHKEMKAKGLNFKSITLMRKLNTLKKKFFLVREQIKKQTDPEINWPYFAKMEILFPDSLNEEINEVAETQNTQLQSETPANDGKQKTSSKRPASIQKPAEENVKSSIGQIIANENSSSLPFTVSSKGNSKATGSSNICNHESFKRQAVSLHKPAETNIESSVGQVFLNDNSSSYLLPYLSPSKEKPKGTGSSGIYDIESFKKQMLALETRRTVAAEKILIQLRKSNKIKKELLEVNIKLFEASKKQEREMELLANNSALGKENHSSDSEEDLVVPGEESVVLDEDLPYEELVLSDEELFEPADNSESESDEEILVPASKPRRKKMKITSYADSIVAFYDNQSFEENFRLTKPAYECILRDVTLVWRHKGKTDINNRLLAVIWLLVTPESYQSVGERFHLCKGILSKCFSTVINALNELAPKYIKWPTDRELVVTKSKFASKYPFRDLIGVANGTYVRIKGPKTLEHEYVNRNGFTSMTLQCVCDSEMRYMHCSVGPSSVPDSMVFKNSEIFLKCQENECEYFPNGEYILGDEAYPCLSWCIPPYTLPRQLTPAEIDFNKKHASTRVIIENSFALLFGRFRRLRDLDMTRTDWIPLTIVACCVLHNICLGFDDPRNEKFMSEGRPYIDLTYFKQNCEDFESETVDGTAKRNRLRDEISKNV